MATAAATSPSALHQASFPVKHRHSLLSEPPRILSQTHTTPSFPLPVLSCPARTANRSAPVRCSHAAASSKPRRGRGETTYDPELRLVLELATDEELYELEQILFGPSYFSPLIKSLAKRRADVDYAMIQEDLEEREGFIAALESRFLFLAADARSTLRGWRPSYRDVLLAVRKKLGVRCSNKLSTQDLEAEIFLHLVEEYASEEESAAMFNGLWELSKASDDQGSLGLGLSKQKLEALAAEKLNGADLKSVILRGGSMFTLSKICQWLETKIAGKMFLAAANYQFRKEAVKKGAQLAAINLESRAALLAAKQGLAGAASRYLGLRSVTSLLGPVMWGTFLADIVIQMLGTDYARILRAIYAFAQIRITRTYRVSSDKK